MLRDLGKSTELTQDLIKGGDVNRQYANLPNTSFIGNLAIIVDNLLKRDTETSLLTENQVLLIGGILTLPDLEGKIFVGLAKSFNPGTNSFLLSYKEKGSDDIFEMVCGENTKNMLMKVKWGVFDKPQPK